MINQLLVAFLSCSVLSLLVWLFLFEYREYRVRALKLHLFSIRDELFAAARRGDIKFSDRAYGMVRTVINGLLMRADSISIPNIVIYNLICNADDKQTSRDGFAIRFGDAKENLSMKGAKAVDEALKKAHFHVMAHIFHISVLLFVPVQLLKLYLNLTVAVRPRLTAASVDLKDIQHGVQAKEAAPEQNSLCDKFEFRSQKYFKSAINNLDEQAYEEGMAGERMPQAA